MSGPAATLREIHRLRRYVRDLQTRIERAPLQLKAQQAHVARQEQNLKSAQEVLKKLKVVTHEKEVSLKSHNQQIRKYEEQLRTITTKKEYDALKLEIEHARAGVQKLEDEILDAMGQTEEKTAELPALEKAVQQAKADLAAFERDSVPRLAELDQERQKARQELSGVEAALPAEVRESYDRQVKARGEDALSAVESRTCVACSTEITAQQYNELIREMFVVCKSCGRMLYLPATQ